MDQKKIQLLPQQRKLRTDRQYMPYHKTDIEGECIMLEISPIRFIYWRYIIFLICNVFIGIPFLIAMWIPKAKRVFYYQFCSYDQATHFYIINYDENMHIAEKKHKVFMKNENQSKFYHYFINRYITYIIDQQGIVRVNLFDYRQSLSKNMRSKQQLNGISQSQVHQIRNSFGQGTMIIQQPSLIDIIIDQTMRPLYLFLFFSVFYWFFNQKYYQFSGILFFISFIGLIINIYQIRQLYQKIYQMAFHQISLNVLRQGTIQSISSIEVVPGDIVFLKESIKLSFQGIILEGSALINQCALTGQSVPIVKKADSYENILDAKISIDKSAFVFEGTTIVQVNDKKRMVKFEEFRQKYGIPVYVVRTNFVTTKGQLIRIILFPKENQNFFQRQSAKFLGFLLGLATLSYIIIAIINKDYVTSSELIQKYISILTITIPPGLPVSMTFGIIYAVDRLKKKQIYCIAQNKVIDGGMVQFSCFDKTGTLTEDFMDFFALVPSKEGKFETAVINNFQNQQKIIQSSYNNKHLFNILSNMAANHSIIKIEATNQLVGDPMQTKAFQFGKFSLNQSHEDHQVIFGFESQRKHSGVVYRRFEFQSDLQRMSVVCKNNSTRQFQVFTKGSPEIIQTLLRSQSKPQNYNQILKQYAASGFRVLALGSKTINANNIKSITRNQAQSFLTFDGFQIFENKLKPQTKGAIKALKNAQIGCVMITGDNTLTGSNISYKCNISDRRKKMIICDYVDNKFTEEQFHYDQDIQDDIDQFESTKKQSYNHQNNDIQMTSVPIKKQSSKQKYVQKQMKNNNIENQHISKVMGRLSQMAQNLNSQLCVTGRAFNELFKGKIQNLSQIEKTFMNHVTVFARTKPNDKAKIVMAYQHMDLKVSMCGDGANDCGALKQADIGLSLSQAQASISAPFTSKIANISSMVQLIIECRGGLVTNFSLFNIMAIYALIQYSTTLICERYLSYPNNFMYLYWDLALNFIYIIFIGYTNTTTSLSIQRPKRSLFSLSNISQVLMVWIIQLIGQIVIIVIFEAIDRDYYNSIGGLQIARTNYFQTQYFGTGLQSCLLFLFINNIYVFSMIVFNIAKPWKQYFFTNIPLMICIVLTLAYNQIIIFWKGGTFYAHQVEQFIPQTMGIRLTVFGISMAFSIAIFVILWLVLDPIFNYLTKKYPHIKWL